MGLWNDGATTFADGSGTGKWLVMVVVQKEAKEWTAGALNLTTQLLATNPEFYTVWNYRRNIFLHGLFPNRCAFSAIPPMRT